MNQTSKYLLLLLLICSSCGQDKRLNTDINSILPESEDILPLSPKEQGTTITHQEMRAFLKAEINLLEDETEKVSKILLLIEYLPSGSRDVFRYIRDGLKLAEKNNLTNEMGELYYQLGWYYFSQNMKENTITSFEKAVEYSTDSEILVYAYCCLSNNSSWDDHHDKALEYAQRGLEIAQASGSPHLEAEAMMVMGDVYRFQNKMGTARSYYRKTVNLLYFEDDNKIVSPFYMVAAVYTGNTSRLAPYTSFYYAFQLKDVYDNSTFREKQMFIYNLMKAADTSIFNTSILETRIAQLTISSLLIISLIVIVIMLIRQTITKRKVNKKLEKANEVKAQLLLIQNHDLRKPIASLVSFLELKKHQPDIPAEELELMDDKILELANKTLKSMEDLIIWSKDQMESFEIRINPVSIPGVFEEMKSAFIHEDSVDISYKIPDSLMMKTDENYLKTIIRNLTQNAIAVSKEAGQRQIIWETKKQKSRFVFSIKNFAGQMSDEHVRILLSEDKGKVSSHGAGLIIIRDLAKALKCKINVEREEESTTIQLYF